uniref:Uncharacterized protein n=1 Tax=Physcomitrium patens TaxID=3218 RepID=A0A7I4CF02_PHYPA
MSLNSAELGGQANQGLSQQALQEPSYGSNVYVTEQEQTKLVPAEALEVQQEA